MKIIADENIPYVGAAFARFGRVSTVHGRWITRDLLRDADMLLVRSITRVNAALLDDTPVRFVATATIGEDHIDKAYLSSRGIGFSSAPGCNADSVAQYMTAALLEIEERLDLPLSGRRIGIVGVGNVGRRVARCALGLGMTPVLNDPPLERQIGDPKYRPIEEALACDIVTLHVPLSRTGPDATHHLADDSFLRKMKPGAMLINTSRGPVADGDAVKRAIGEGRLRACVLDVWEHEPEIDIELLNRAFIGTSHIAGYSFDGKVNGTRQIYEAACRFFNVQPDWDPAPLLPAPECPRLEVDGRDARAVISAVHAVYDIMRDDAALRGIIQVAPAERGRFFDLLRREYPRRREFKNTAVRVTPSNAAVERTLREIGFNVLD